MRCELHRLLQPRRVKHLKNHIESMTVQLVGVVYLHKLHVFCPLVCQTLQRLRQRGLAASRYSYDCYPNHAAKLLLFFDICNTY